MKTQYEVTSVNPGPELIGDVVSIQVIPKKADGDLDLSRMEKHVGTLLSYVTSELFFDFKMEGASSMVRLPHKKFSIEIYKYEPRRK